MGVRGGAGAAWAALFRRKGSVACLHLPLELVSGPGTRGWAAFCWLDRNFEVPGAFSAPQSAPLRQSSRRRLVGREHALSTPKLSMPVSAPFNAREYVSRLFPASLQPRYPGAGFPAPGAAIHTGQKMLRPKSFFFRCGRPPRPSARPPGIPHWWRGRPSQQFARKETFRAPRTGVLDTFGPLERELARPQTRAPATRALRADMCLTVAPHR